MRDKAETKAKDWPGESGRRYPVSLQTEGELLVMNQEQLQAEMDKALAELEDLEELRHGFLGQTGVHIGMRVLKSASRQFEQEEVRLKERIALLQKLLRTDDSSSPGAIS